MDDSEGEKGQLYEGTVRSYRPEKDYGFITSAELSKDVYFRSSDLPDDFRAGSGGFCRLDGLEVTYKLHKLPDGKPQAKHIQVRGAEGTLMMGTVKSFNLKGGYGFIVSSAIEGDLFFDKKEVPPHINPSSMAGLFARFELAHDDKRGKYKAVFCDFKVEQMPPPAHPYGYGGMPFYGHPGEMPYYGSLPPPEDPQSLPFPHAGYPSAVAWGPPPAPRQPFAPEMPPPGPGGPMVGDVKSWNGQKQYGFLRTPGLNADIYFRGADVVGETEMQAGQRVSFILRYRADGQPHAKDVALMSGSDATYDYGGEAPPGNGEVKEKRKRVRNRRGGDAKRARVEGQEPGSAQFQDNAPPGAQARPRPSSAADRRVPQAQGRELFGVIHTEWERVRGCGYLINDATGEELPFSDSNPKFTEGEEVAFRIQIGPQREELAIGLRLVDP